MPKVKAKANPKITTKKEKRAASNAVEISDSMTSDEEVDEMPRSPNISDTDSRRSLTEADVRVADNPDFAGGMTNLLEKFSSDLNKTMMAKRRKLEQIMQEFAQCTAKKTIENGKTQSCERKRVIESFKDEMLNVLNQGEVELEKLKDGDEKLQKAIVQQQKQHNLLRIAHGQRLKALKSLAENFCEGMDVLEGRHVEQYSSVHNELKKELSMLQKKILMDIQQQEMMNVRKHLKSILP